MKPPRALVLLSALLVVVAGTVHAEDLKKKTATGPTSSQQRLRILDTVLIDDPRSSVVGGRFSCDNDGNLYFLSLSENSAVGFNINKLSPGDKQLTRVSFNNLGDPGPWRPSTALLALPQGGVLSLMYALKKNEKADVYLVRFKADGDVDSKERLEMKGTVERVAPFETGEVLIDGRLEGEDRTISPLTVIVSKGGTVLHKVRLDGDKELESSLKGFDPDTAGAAESPTKAIDLSFMEPGKDGFIYLVRYSSPYIVYGISSDGTITRKFKVDAPEEGYSLRSMHVGDGRIAMLFGPDGPGRPRIMRIVDSSNGDDIANYEVEDVGAAFACYSQGERFTFLSTREKKLTVQITSP